ncbi:hypothetical protein COU37_03735 [Candidatus Micrarchaeota archaeon CG10_big_fil_rev_8_21_14_0_10_45_29]|nr:MAG: hypothetical protein COU37_03735 [Candidatus Micrarchaeota archaeon CG10_big_fil_rev_8_21_14_0_10_45_29]
MAFGKNIFSIFAFLLLLGAAAFAASSAVLQITNYDVTAVEVYAGSLGYASLTIKNTGTSTATSVNAYYYLEGSSQYMYIGDIVGGTEAIVSIPYKIPEGASGSIQLQKIDINYLQESGDNAGYKKTSLTFPISVLELNPISVETLSDSQISVAPGEKLTVDLQITNNGGNMNNIAISAANDSQFFLVGMSEKFIGSLDSGKTLNTTLSLVSSPSLDEGIYNIPITITYKNSLKQKSQSTFYVGPASILSATKQYRVQLTPVDGAEVGSEAEFNLVVSNYGTEASSLTLTLEKTDVLTPIGINTFYFDDLGAGKKQTQKVILGIAPDASSGYYIMPITLSSESGNMAEFDAGITVEGTPQLMVYLDNSVASDARIQLSNTGNSDLRGVYVTVSPQSKQWTAQSFIGTLNVDDFDYVSLSSYPLSGTLNVEIEYKDSNNRNHKEILTLDAGATQGSFGASSAKNSTSASLPSQVNTNPRGGGGVLPFMRSTGTTTDGINPLLIVGALAIVAIAAYLLYKYKFKKPKHGEKK